MDTLAAGIVVTDREAETAPGEAERLFYEDLVREEADDALLMRIREQAVDTDPLYVNFTSGSTGTPKGVAVCHRSVIDYIESFTLATGMDETNVFANQAPLYFDAPLKEIGATIKFGATTYIVPKQLFMFPIKLVEYLNEHKINTLCWAASALSLVSSMKTFNKIIPEYVKTITFVGEVFPVK